MRRQAALRTVLAVDADVNVRIAAAVSLLILGETSPRGQILAWLESRQSVEQGRVVEQLERVADPRLLMFARVSLQRIADHPEAMPYGLGQRLQRLLQRIPHAD